MLGTIVNATTIIIGGCFGALVRQSVKEKYRKTLFDALGLACLPLGINATVSNMPKSEIPVLFIVSLAIGTLIGTRLDFAGRIERYQSKKEKKVLQVLMMVEMMKKVEKTTVEVEAEAVVVAITKEKTEINLK